MYADDKNMEGMEIKIEKIPSKDVGSLYSDRCKLTFEIVGTEEDLKYLRVLIIKGVSERLQTQALPGGTP